MLTSLDCRTYLVIPQFYFFNENVAGVINYLNEFMCNARRKCGVNCKRQNFHSAKILGGKISGDEITFSRTPDPPVVIPFKISLKYDFYF